MGYYEETSPLEFISDVYDIMKDGDCLSPEKLNADVVDMLDKYLSAQHRVQADLPIVCDNCFVRRASGDLCENCGSPNTASR